MVSPETALRSSLNWAFDQNHHSRQRDLFMCTAPWQVPILDDGVLVVKADTSEHMTSLYELYQRQQRLATLRRQHSSASNSNSNSDNNMNNITLLSTTSTSPMFSFSIQQSLWKTRQLSSGAGVKGKEQVFDVMKASTSNSLIKQYLTKYCNSSSQMYSSTRLFALQLGIQYGLQLLLSSAAVTPRHFYISAGGQVSCCSHGSVYSIETYQKLRSGILLHRALLKKNIMTSPASKSGATAIKQESPSLSSTTATTSSNNIINEIYERLQYAVENIIHANSRDQNEIYTSSNSNSNQLPPFRLTQNITACLSRAMLVGCTVTALGSTLDTITANLDIFEVSLNFFDAFYF